MNRNVKPLKRSWARAYWVCEAGLPLSIALILLLGAGLPAWLLPGAFLAGAVVCQEKLRCPCCGQSLSSIPRVRRGTGGVCRYCGHTIVYDDEKNPGTGG